MKKKIKGFTLIELLVVIAIIGILAAALIPAVAGALLKAKLNGVMNNGRQIYIAAFDTYMSDPNYGTGEWAFPEEDSTNVTTSTIYFQELIDKKGLDATFAYFATPDTKIGSGTNSTASGATFDEDYNGWNLTLGASPEQSGLPWIFTKNLTVSGNKLPTGTGSSGTIDSNSKFPENVIVIRTGGSSENAPKAVIDNASLFNPVGSENPVVVP